MTSARQTSLSSAGAADRPKHRACDECRARKLACSKEADGCRRCKREGIACVYSAQKQMGRPRKRRPADLAATASAEPNTASNTVSNTAAPITSNSSAPGDVGLAFLSDQSSPGVSFFDFLGLGEMDLVPISSPATPSIPTVLGKPAADIAQQPLPSPKPGRTSNWSLLMPRTPWSNPLTEIDFSTSSASETPSGGCSSSDHSFTPPEDIDGAAATGALSQVDPNLLVLPPHEHNCCGKWPGANGSSSGGDKNRQNHGVGEGQSSAPDACVITAPSKVCSCLARLYLALDSLQDLPTEIAAAIAVARNAAHAAHDTMLCPSCSPPHFNDIDFIPPLQSFQNLMILSALLPSIAHAYRRIVEMVDTEATRAAAAHEKLSVGLKQYGGIWGRLARWDNMCAASTERECSLVDPPLWRLAMRALLKVDVYGVHVEKGAASCEVSPGRAACWGQGDGAEAAKAAGGAALASMGQTKTAAGNTLCAGCNALDMAAPPPTSSINSNMTSLHIGLKDIVEMMEARAKFRHDCLDAAADAGLLDNAQTKGYVRLPPGEKHNCQKIIDIARKEIDKLVIV